MLSVPIAEVGYTGELFWDPLHGSLYFLVRQGRPLQAQGISLAGLASSDSALSIFLSLFVSLSLHLPPFVVCSAFVYVPGSFKIVVAVASVDEPCRLLSLWIWSVGCLSGCCNLQFAAEASLKHVCSAGPDEVHLRRTSGVRIFVVARLFLHSVLWLFRDPFLQFVVGSFFLLACIHLLHLHTEFLTTLPTRSQRTAATLG